MIPNLAWDGEATVVGILIVLVLLLAFDIIAPRSRVKAAERRYEYERETNRRNTEALETIADAAEERNAVDDSLEKIMTTLQERGGGK